MAEGVLLELDLNSKLEITINNTRPVELVDLTMALLGVGQQFERFMDAEIVDQQRIGSELFIKEVRSGSIVIELLAQAAPVLPLLWAHGTLDQWVKYASDVLLWLTGKLQAPPREIRKQDLIQWNNILEPIAKDNGSQLNFSVSNGGTVTNNIYINSAQANAAQNRITRELQELDAPTDHVIRNQVMTWNQTRFTDNSLTGDKVIIESISKSPVKVLFENQAIKKAMTDGDPNFEKSWQRLAYIVDVTVQYIRDVPKLYTIINYQPLETFDPDDE